MHRGHAALALLLLLAPCRPALADETRGDGALLPAEPARLATLTDLGDYWTAACGQMQAIYTDLEAQWPLAYPAPTGLPREAVLVLGNAANQAQMLLQEAFERIDPAVPRGALVIATLAEFNSHAWYRYLAALWSDPNWTEAARQCFRQCAMTGDIADLALLASAPGWSVLSAAGQAWAYPELTIPPAEEAAPPGAWSGPVPAPAPDGTIVYVTRGGTKYHGEGCAYVGQKPLSVRLGEARAAGYEPCSRCW